ncbi:hypothetical protein [Anoxybacteroides tepidamans]|uniref:hypothetical protein n=1 Tax=Anoxybacteroides tepidamans TaxID=265948 RepID=UPI0004896471|nr:hypothetical protein [Anoxybacillus tepidamans]
MKHTETFSLADLDESPYLAFSTGIHVNQLPIVIEETSFDRAISFDDVCSAANGKKLLISYFPLSLFLRRHLKKYRHVTVQHMEIAVIEDFEFTLDLFDLLQEIEYTNVYVFADFSGEFEVLLPKERMDGMTFSFDELHQLVFIQFESKKIITFTY